LIQSTSPTKATATLSIRLDEINTTYYCRLVTLKEMMEMTIAKPDGVELVFIGRYARHELAAEADLVTEMKPVKHYHRKGVQARVGIEH
jgi:cob(I)alamin adenosyltransferase